MKWNRIPIVLAGLALSLGLAACENDPAGSNTARVSVLLTDAPGDFASADVEIREIYLVGDADEEGTNGRITLFDGSALFDLLDLQNGVTAELAQVTVPPGTYHQIRLVIGDATITTEGGTTYSTEDNTLKCPSCAQSGLKVKLPGGGLTLASGEQSIVVDFDVAQSFGHAAGKSGRWIMHPVIRATRAEASGGITGMVTLAEGVTLPTCGGAAVDLTHFVPTAVDGEVSMTGAVGSDGALRFSFVGPATYTMGYTSTIEYDNGDTLAFTATPSVTAATVSSGADFVVDYVITDATCTPAPAPAAT